jgi:hypothetical protein
MRFRGSRYDNPVFEIELSPVPVGAVHESHGDMTTIED